MSFVFKEKPEEIETVVNNILTDGADSYLFYQAIQALAFEVNTALEISAEEIQANLLKMIALAKSDELGAVTATQFLHALGLIDGVQDYTISIPESISN